MESILKTEISEEYKTTYLPFIKEEKPFTPDEIKNLPIDTHTKYLTIMQEETDG
ncbi:hypothetical protein ILUMI_12023, partial [Ignelater luminosus]